MVESLSAAASTEKYGESTSQWTDDDIEMEIDITRCKINQCSDDSDYIHLSLRIQLKPLATLLQSKLGIFLESLTVRPANAETKKKL